MAMTGGHDGHIALAKVQMLCGKLVIKTTCA